MTQEQLSKFNSAMEKIANGEFFRKSRPEDHQTKFELWDKVYFMYENRVTEAYICEINIQILPMPKTDKVTNIKYKLTTITPKNATSKNYMESFAEVEEYECYATKEELLQTL